jgi:glycosyltransferase 2 family protein
MKKKVASGIFSVIIFSLLIYFLKDIDFLQVWHILKQTNKFWLLLGFLSCGMVYIIWNLRWKINLSKVKKVKYLSLLPFLFSGVFLNMISPTKALGGEIARAYFLNKKYKISKSKVLGTILADKSFYLLALLFLGIFSLFFSIFYFELNNKLLVFFITLLGVSIIFLIFVLIFLIRKQNVRLFFLFRFLYMLSFVKKHFKTKQKYYGYIHRKIREFKKMYSGAIYDKHTLFSNIILSFLQWTFHFLTVFFVLFALGTPLKFIYVVVIFTLSYFIGDLSLVPGGIGLTEGVMFLLYTSVGINSELAVSVILLSSVLRYFFSIVIAGACWSYLRLKYSWLNKGH